jgi:peroxiredoxin
MRHTVAHSVTDTDYTKIGPRVGEMFPDFELPDATGQPVRLTQWRNDRRALAFFFRSAAW